MSIKQDSLIKPSFVHRMPRSERMRFRIPESQREAIRWLASAPDGFIDALESQLRGARTAIDAEGLASQVTAEIGIEGGAVPILDALLSLAVSRNRLGLDVIDVITEVSGVAGFEVQIRLSKHGL